MEMNILSGKKGAELFYLFLNTKDKVSRSDWTKLRLNFVMKLAGKSVRDLATEQYAQRKVSYRQERTLFL